MSGPDLGAISDSATQRDATRANIPEELASPSEPLALRSDDILRLHAADILERVADAFILLDADWHILYANREACRINQKPFEEFVGRLHWEEWPAAVGTELERQFRRAKEELVDVHFEHRYVFEPYDVWLEIDAYPMQDGLSLFYRDISTRKRAEEERERMLVEQHARAEREALVNRINEAIRATTDPDLIQETAAALVGEALGADRCYFSVYNPQRDAVRIERDWHRAGLPSVAGEYHLSEYRGYVDALYGNGTAIITDAQGDNVSQAVGQVLSGFGIRAFLAVPLFDSGKFAGALAASMSGTPRLWRPDEISLMETVLTQTRTAIETARVVRREHQIAEHLQAALQPTLPGTVPGLALTSYYRPALAESEGVGGDFFDVFSVEKGCTALAVGDLSGKGLAAATQVSTVRNMLRYAVYRARTLAAAVQGLNAILAEQELLTGFTTLFVGTYDSATGRLNYVNCGQEPALVRRAKPGTVETLGPTGPILGAIESAQYTESSVTLASGDALAIFTDGLTEVGRSHRDLLGVKGMATLLAQPVNSGNVQDAQQTVEELARTVIAGVDTYAGSGGRDDMCLLVAMVR